ncbi:hypothetical protein P8452_14443 [Trifolium repens]|nr:hypothetical protein P8452_14443 [Trifolium repens]
MAEQIPYGVASSLIDSFPFLQSALLILSESFEPWLSKFHMVLLQASLTGWLLQPFVNLDEFMVLWMNWRG